MIINIHHSLSNLVTKEHILIELDPKLGGTLIAAAASGDIYRLLMKLVLSELHRWLVDNQHLLIFKLSPVMILDDCFDFVHNVCLGTLSMVQVLVHDRRRNVWW